MQIVNDIILLWLGAIAGYAICCLMVAAKRGDER